MLRRRHEATITLTDNQGQTEAWERRALADLRAGDPEAAVAAYAEHSRVHTALPDQLADRIVEDYLGLTNQRAPNTGEPPGEHVVMLAARRADVADLNETIRARLLDAGQLGPVAVTVGEGNQQREYRAGDRVIVTAKRLAARGPQRHTSNHFYVPDVTDDNQTTRVEDQSHLDWLAARLAVGHIQTLASRQLPRAVNDRWRSPTRHDTPYRQAEGISR